MLTILLCLLCLHSRGDSTLPDSLLTIENIKQCATTDINLGALIATQMRNQKKAERFDIDLAEAIMYYYSNNYSRAYSLLHKMKTKVDEKKHPEQIMKIAFWLQACCCDMAKEDEQAEHLKDALRLANQLNDRAMKSMALVDLGRMVFKQGAHKTGLSYAEQGTNIMENITYAKRFESLGFYYDILVMMLIEEKDFQKALGMVEKQAALLRERKRKGVAIPNDRDMKDMLSLRAFVLNRLDRKAEADAAYREWQTYYNRTKSYEDYFIGRYLCDKKMYDDLLEVTKTNAEYYRERQDTVNNGMMEVIRLMSVAYKEMGDHENATKALTTLTLIKDSLSKRNNKAAAFELASAYQQNEQKRHEAERQTERNLGIIAVISLALLTALLLVLYLRNRHYTLKIKSRNTALANSISELTKLKEKDNTQNLNPLPSQPLPLNTPQKIDITSTSNDKDIFTQLDNRIEKDLLYLNADFSRESLIKLTGLDKNRIARIVSDATGCNISTYISRKRLEYSVKLLKEKPSYTIKAVAEECGIGSLASFNRLFKKEYGMTPTEFRMANNNSIYENDMQQS